MFPPPSSSCRTSAHQLDGMRGGELKNLTILHSCPFPFRFLSRSFHFLLFSCFFPVPPFPFLLPSLSVPVPFLSFQGDRLFSERGLTPPCLHTYQILTNQNRFLYQQFNTSHVKLRYRHALPTLANQLAHSYMRGRVGGRGVSH